jgi:hypothetical protein
MLSIFLYCAANADAKRVKDKLIVAREISCAREQISIQRSAARGIILSSRNRSECERGGIANPMPSLGSRNKSGTDRKKEINHV